MPSQLIENVVFEIKQIVDYPEVLDDWIYTKINDRWKDHKHHVQKAAYKKWNTVEERISNPPHNVVESQWRVLVEVWNTDLKKQTGLAYSSLGVYPKEQLSQQKIDGLTIKKTEDPDEVLMDPEVAAELKEMEEVEIQASQPGSDIVLQGRHDAFSQVRRRDKGGRVRCLGNGIKPKKYWDEESSTNPTTDPNAEVLNLRQQLETTIAELQAAMQRIAELEALVAYHGLGTANTVTPSTDTEARNSP
ncbi:hypothetical protein MKW98_026215 [Papaver atlanticum]|uniref:Transposase n=1 Tax=Papaver atlanticum TaxID=357466 RepID=A0AAD4XQY1_9MAGN|nr:hypothetical protein MKW98_026215 [Papaver atlanticum]